MCKWTEGSLRFTSIGEFFTDRYGEAAVVQPDNHRLFVLRRID